MKKTQKVRAVIKLCILKVSAAGGVGIAAGAALAVLSTKLKRKSGKKEAAA